MWRSNTQMISESLKYCPKPFTKNNSFSCDIAMCIVLHRILVRRLSPFPALQKLKKNISAYFAHHCQRSGVPRARGRFWEIRARWKGNVKETFTRQPARCARDIARTWPKLHRVVPLINVHEICGPLAPCVKVVTLAIRESTITFARGGERVAHKPRERFLFLRVYGIKSLCPCLTEITLFFWYSL